MATTSYFPGHMAKARRQLKELLPALDVGVLLLDARIPGASLGQGLAELMRTRPVVYALNKADLADPVWTARWQAHLGQAVTLEAQSGRGVQALLDLCLQVGRPRLKMNRPVRLAVLGIPNVGKSSFLNRVAGRRAAAVGDKPGITRARQWVRARPDLEILDLPGLLQPRLGEPGVGLLLSLMAAIKDEIEGREELAREAIRVLEIRYPGRLGERYGIEPTGDLQQDLENIGRARGHLLAGDRVDTERAAAALLSDLRGGRLGRITLESPGST